MSWMPHSSQPPASQQRPAPVPLQAPFHGPLPHNNATQMASGVVTSHTSPPVYPPEVPVNSANIDGGGSVAIANTANGHTSGNTNTLLGRGGRGVDTATTTSAPPTQMFVDQQQQQQQLASPPPPQFTNQQYKHQPHLASPSNWQQQNITAQQQQQQPQNVSSKMMPPTVAAPNNWQQQQQQQPANYFHQQQQQQQQQPPVQLPNQQPQQQPVMGVNSWQPTEHHQMPPANVYGQQQQQQQPHQEPPAAAMYQQQQPHPGQATHNPSDYFGQQQQSSHEYFMDNTNNNSGGTNGGTKNDGWGDWDWNDNSNDFQQQQQQHPSTQQQHPVPQQQHHLQPQQAPPTQQHQQAPPQQHQQPPPPQQHQQQPPQQHQQPPPQQQQQQHQQPPPPQQHQQPPPPQQHQQPPPPQQPPTQPNQLQPQQPVEPNANFQPPQFHPNVIEDSFSTNSNDNWQWNISDTVPPATAAGIAAEPTLSGGQKEQLAASFPAPEPAIEQFPAPPAGDSNATPPQGAGSAVFVSQAKPVPRPTRQYASLPADTVSAPDSAVTPPQAFQNESMAEQQAATPPAAVPPPPAKPDTVATMPPAAAPPAGPTPLPPMGGPRGANPFKRAGAAQHHRAAGLLGPNPNTLPPPLAVAESAATTLQAAANAFAMPPPPPADFANPIVADSTEGFHENPEVVAAPAAPSISLPNSDRNQYLQTSHLSENPDYDGANLDGDSALPPPGLSRLVLGQPELAEAAIRMVTGTEEPSAGNNLDIEERHADGEDTSGEQAMMMPPQPDRNRYLVPGESQASNEQRVVTGVERTPTGPATGQSAAAGAVAAPQIISEQREIVLDGENLEDLEQQHQQPPPHHSLMRNEPPLEGAVSSAAPPQAPVDVEAAPPGDSNLVQSAYSAKSKDTLSLTNASTGNDESDPLQEEDFDEAEERRHRGQGRYNAKTRGGGGKYDTAGGERSKLDKSRKDKRSVERSSEETADEEDDYHLSMRERDRRRHREGSVRSDREERDYKERQRREGKRDAAPGSRDKYGGYASGSKGDRSQRSQRYSSRYENGAADSSKYETEESARHGKESMRRSMRGGAQAPVAGAEDRRSDRSDRDYDEYKRWYRGSKRGEERERRDRYGGESADHEARRREGGRHYRRGERDDYDTAERRRRSDKHRTGGEVAAAAASAREYEEYRKQSSRNARESDLEKEGGRSARGGDPRYDPRLHGNAGSAAMMYGAYPGYAYDPSYAAYYYEQMARTNPQAYSEWYKKYYGHAATAAAPSSAVALAAAQAHHAAGGSMDHMSLARDDGRESVHSGRSSIAAMHSDKDRYTQAYISQANDYHHHHHHQQQQVQQQQHRYPYHSQNYSNQLHHQQIGYQNVSLNGTQMLLDDGDAGSVVGGDRMSSARSIGNLSQSGLGSGGGFYGSSASISMMAVDHHYHHHHLQQQQQQHQLQQQQQQQQQQQYHQRHSQHHQYYARSEYADSRSGNMSMREPEPDPQRLTPCKFINEHTVVSIGGGVLVTVKPKYTPHGSISNVVRLQRIQANDGMRHLFQTYPGPLVRGLTHKKTIIEFCEEQIRLGPMQTTIFAKQLLPSNGDKCKASYTLMWHLLILLLRQNGMVVGTDIAELLLKNQQQFPYQAANQLMAGSPQQAKSVAAASDGSEADYDKLSDEAAAPEDPSQEAEGDDTSEAKPRGDANENEEKRSNELAGEEAPGVAALSEEEITEKFRNYLLYGNVNEALEWATDNNLWGHALFLASKVDRRSHANVMMKFANKLALNDPLQTLYQLMSGRTPSSVTSVQDEKWGDWRPHLSMILSNTSQKPELDRKAITTLGDSLFNRGDLFAAHFCYLMAQVGFGRYQESATGETTLQQSLPKLVLLGSSHYKSLRDFATNESIMMTEIYEYACSLNDDKFSLVEFQPYKFLLATRMADYGFHLKSLMYMEQIAVHIERDSSKYEASFIQKVYDLADRLKFYDPVLEKTLDDQQPDGSGGPGGSQQFEEQKWLQNLRNTVSQYQHSAGLYEPHQSAAQYQNQIDQQFDEINKQFNELNLQYANDVSQPAAQSAPVEPQFYNPEAISGGQAVAEPPQPPQPVGDYMQQPQTQAAELPADQGQDPYGGYGQQQQQAAHQQQQYMQPESQNAFYDPQQQQQQHQQQQQQYNSMDPNASYDYYGSQQQQQQMQQQQPSYGDEQNAPRPTISMPKSKTYDSDEDTGKSRKQQQQKGGAPPPGGKLGEQQRGKADNKEKNSQAANQNSGWFGGIWNKLSLKPKNQMILPDDKNPTIVWDPEKKRWVNTGDGDDAAEEALKPPPKMSDIVSQAQQQQQQQQQFPPPQQQQHQQQQQQPFQQQQQYGQPQMPSMEATPSYGQLPGGPVPMAPNYPPGAASPAPAPAVPAANEQAMPVAAAAPTGAAKPPSLQSNMFKMQRNRTLKNSYVDVFNPSGAPMSSAADNVMAPAVPPAAVPAGGFFIPGAPPAGAEQQQQGGGYQQQQDVPQFYNPNQYGNPAASGGY